MIDILFLTSNNSNGIYQDLSNKYSAIKTPTWSLLLAQSCRSQNYKVEILDRLAESLNDEDIFIKNNNNKCFVIDLLRLKPISKKLIATLKNNKKIIIVDEKYFAGNLSSSVFEAFSNLKIYAKIKSLYLSEEHVFENGVRDYLLKKNNLDSHNRELGLIRNY
jgi:deoxyxylulose-5-phosphate synthase